MSSQDNPQDSVRASHGQSAVGVLLLLEAVVASSHHPVLLLDADGRILLVNEAGCRLFGGSATLLSGLLLAELATPTEAAMLKRRLRLIHKGGSRSWVANWRGAGRTQVCTQVEAQYVAVDGGRYVLWLRQPSCQGRLAALLKDEEERQRQVILAGEQGGWELDLTSGRLLFSAQWRSAFDDPRRPLEATLGAWLGRVPESEREPLLAELARLRVGEVAEALVHHRQRRGDDELVTVRTRILALHDALGATIGLVAGQTIVEQRCEPRVERRFRLLTTLAELTVELVDLPLAELDRAATGALGRVAEVLGADRAQLFCLDLAGQTVRNSHEWCAPGTEPVRAELQALPLSELGWWLGWLQASEPVLLGDVADLPPAGEDLRAELAREGVQSLLVQPVMHDQVLLGVVAFEARQAPQHWSQPELRGVQALGALLQRLCAPPEPGGCA